jgi:uncharacterized membrane protein (DUF2068 family)
MIALINPCCEKSGQSDERSAAMPRLTRWDDRILRLIAIYHLLKASFFVAIGLGVLHFVHQDLAQVINDDLIEPFKLSPDGKFLRNLLEWASTLTPHGLRLISYLFFCYGFIFAIEGIGLYLRKHWAEYMVVIVVASLLPFEIYEICLTLAWWKVLLLAGNIFIVAFLVRRLVLEWFIPIA